MEQMKLYTHDEMMDSVIGKKGTPRRDKLDADLKTFLMGEAIKKAREERHLTQEQLGNLIGVKKSQVSRMERGANLSFSTMARVFKAMRIFLRILVCLVLERLPCGKVKTDGFYLCVWKPSVLSM